jgi:signal transduction histidine kinase
MGSQLDDFISAHSRRVGALFAAEMEKSRQDGKTGQSGARAADFIAAVLRALSDSDLAPIQNLCQLNANTAGLDARLELTMRRIELLGRVIAAVANEQGLPQEPRQSLSRIAAEELSELGRQLATRTVGDLARQLANVSSSAGARGANLSITMHELRRPLTILSSYGQLLSTGVLGPLPETAQVAIEGISASTEMMVRMVNSLAEVSRLEDPDDLLVLEELPVIDLVGAAVEHVSMEAQLREITIEKVVEQDGAVRVDRRRVVLALTNLLSNAIKYGPPNTRVTVRCYGDGEGLHFLVTDQGPGFPDADASHLFEKYFRSIAERQRQVPGSGLGLYIVRSVAERHGGSVTARQAEGGGAEFEIVIPSQQ